MTRDEIERLLNENIDGFTYRVEETGANTFTAVGMYRSPVYGLWRGSVFFGPEYDVAMVRSLHKLIMREYTDAVTEAAEERERDNKA